MDTLAVIVAVAVGEPDGVPLVDGEAVTVPLAVKVTDGDADMVPV